MPCSETSTLYECVCFCTCTSAGRCEHVCVAAPGCSPAGILDQSSPFSTGQSGPERPAAPGSGGRCGSSAHPSAAGVSPAVEVKRLLHHQRHCASDNALLPAVAPATPYSTL